MIRPLLVFAGLFLAGMAAPSPASALQCSASFPEVCQSCVEVDAAFRARPDLPPRQRGKAIWTPLYAAYFHDCYALARRYLDRGQSPSLGGDEGDLLATIVLWDRFDYTYRRAWAKMLVEHGANLDATGLDGRTTRDRLTQSAANDPDIARLLGDIQRWLNEQ